MAPEETVFAALEKLLGEEVEHLPVLADGRLVGICTRIDVLRARPTTKGASPAGGLFSAPAHLDK